MHLSRGVPVAIAIAVLIAVPAEARKRRSVRSPGPPPIERAVASADGYVTDQNVMLTVAAPGIFGNDTLNGASLSSYGAATGMEQAAIGSSTPTANGGSVSIAADGSLSYTPPTGFSGNDTFKYVLANGGGTSTGEVTVIVQAVAEFDYEIQSPGFFFTFSGVAGQNPEIHLQAGRTYRFKVNTSPSHPFEIKGVPPGSVTNNGISEGLLTFAVPNATAGYEYWCPIHDFGNRFTVP